MVVVGFLNVDLWYHVGAGGRILGALGRSQSRECKVQRFNVEAY